MPPKQPHSPSVTPAPRIQAVRGYGRIKLGGRQISLGPIDSPDLQARYQEEIRRFVEQGYTWSTQVASVRTVGEVLHRYADWARGVYRRRNKPTTMAAVAERVSELLIYAELASLPPAAFGPLALQDFRAWMAEDPHGRWSLTTIRAYSKAITIAFSWAAGQELISKELADRLRAVPQLRRGRAVAPGVPVPRPGRKVESPPAAAIEAVAAAANPTIAAMIRLQLATAMRPEEVCYMRAGEVDTSGRVKGKPLWVYTPGADANKVLEHDHIDRVIYLGPAAVAILEPLLAALGPSDFVFSAARAEAARRASLVKSPDRLGRRRRRSPRRKPGSHYTPASYRRAIERLCDDLQIARWTPGQLRHAAATRIAAESDVDTARLLLGHTDIRTTLRYLDRLSGKAAKAAARLA